MEIFGTFIAVIIARFVYDLFIDGSYWKTQYEEEKLAKKFWEDKYFQVSGQFRKLVEKDIENTKEFNFN